jgi:plastocyanin
MKTLIYSVRVAALALAATFFLQSLPSARAASYDISMTASGFVPNYLEVTIGDTVNWWNDDYFDDHSTTSYTYPWYSGAVPPGYGVYLVTGKTGTYDYTDDVSLSGSGTLVIKPVAPPPGSATLIPAPGRVDTVYDARRDIVYISSGSTVLRYQLASDTFLTPFQLSGSLMGMDLSPDGNTLLVCDSSANTNVWVHVVDLTTGTSHQAFFPAAFYESGTFAVAFGGDGAALITSRFAGSGWVPLRRFDPVSGAATTIASVRHDSMVSSSADGTAIIVAEADISNGPFHRYDVAQRTFTLNAGDNWSNYECAASRNAACYAVPTYGSTFIYDGNFNRVTNIGVYAGAQPIGAAFHPSADAVFFPFAGTPYVNAYSTVNWALLAQYNFGNNFSAPGNHAFNNGRIRLSPDGQVIFVTVSGGVSYLRHSLNVPLTRRLLVTATPALYGTPTPLPYGSYWLADATNLTISVPAVVQANNQTMLCTGWTTTGCSYSSGADPFVSLSLTANTTLTWHWTPFVLSIAPQPGHQFQLQWNSLGGHTYDLLFATNLAGPFTPMTTGIAGTPPVNSYVTPAGPTRAGYFKVLMH